jgi:Family of unknown function (DUF6152)
MTFSIWRLVAAAVVILVASGTVSAHHSFAMFDQDKLVTLKGSVAEWYWINPHGHIILKVDAAPGVDPKFVGEWDIECASTSIMRLQGWSSTTLKPGDQVTISANPLKDGTKGASLFYATFPDGKRLYRDIARPKGKS